MVYSLDATPCTTGGQAMSDEEYVLAKWDRVEECPRTDGTHLTWRISLGGWGFTKASIPDNWARSKAEAWSAAAEFTRDRLEQIRQVREEIAMLAGKLLLEDKDMAAMRRVLDRENAELAKLTAGMKP